MKPRNFSPWAYWMLRLEQSGLADPGPLDRDSLEALLGPSPEHVPLDLEVRESLDCGTYERQSIVFDSEAGMSVPAFLLVPHDRATPGPAVLAQHGHGPGKAEVCAPDGDNNYGHALAERGYVVLAPDLRCFGERADWTPPDKYRCDLNLVHAYAAGTNPLAQNLWDLQCSLDVLEQHSLVDAERIGMVGLSYGGTMTLFLAACDDRVRASVVSGYFNEWVDCHQVPWNLCGSQVLPGMLHELDHVGLGSLVAPRALLVESGTKDLIFPVGAARRAFERLSVVYAELGARQALEHDVFEGGHRWHGERAYEFLAEHLRMRQ